LGGILGNSFAGIRAEQVERASSVGLLASTSSKLDKGLDRIGEGRWICQTVELEYLVNMGIQLAVLKKCFVIMISDEDVKRSMEAKF
jgi:hypothetical protein